MRAKIFLLILCLVTTLTQAQFTPPSFSYDKVGIDPDLAFVCDDVTQFHQGSFVVATVISTTVNGVKQPSKIKWSLKPNTLIFYHGASELIEDELQYATKTSSTPTKVVYDRPKNPLSRTGKPTGLPKATITYTATATGSQKTIRQETPMFSFPLGSYAMFIGKTKAQIALEQNLDSISFDPNTPISDEHTKYIVWASANRVAKDVFLIGSSESRLWDRTAITTTHVTGAANQVHSVYPLVQIIGDTVYNSTFINETYWKNINILGMKSPGNTTYGVPMYTYRLNLYNGCNSPNYTESQLIAGWGIAGQCKDYIDFYWDATAQDADKWVLKQSTSQYIDKATKTIYYDPSKNAFLKIEAVIAPKSNPNAKTWANDTSIWIQTKEQHSDLFGWFGAVLAR